MVLSYPTELVKNSAEGKRQAAAMPEVIFAGPEGRLEGRYHPQKD
ncbi:MAG TPA: alpha/beta hydrolase, partial [Paracoccaceae bacterium]